MLRLLILILSATVAGTLFHTFRIYKGNAYLDLRSGELPMTWPARTNLVATWFLFGVAVYSFAVSGAIMSMAYKRSFRRPIKRRDLYRVVAGSAGVVLWGVGLAVFSLMEKGHKASLGRYACANRNVMSNGRYQYKAVCSEQGLAYYLAMIAACAEALTLITLGLTALHSGKSSKKRPILVYAEKPSGRLP